VVELGASAKYKPPPVLLELRRHIGAKYVSDF
jgi:hypothetical protein